ncbi:hypothetical protein EZS27_028043 [termite gut metagenome]|uniref:Uncharacterized protein n=1 Tax=termite gut metagenome TaxID=433724 RepID=A0A5J4QNC1_9ZZZZ
MENIFDKIRHSFLNELTEEGDFWRIFRFETLIDLIRVNLLCFQKQKNELYLFKIINYSLKIELLNILSPIELVDNLQESFDKFNKDSTFISDKLDILLAEISNHYCKDSKTSISDINIEIEKVDNVLIKTIAFDSIINQIIYKSIDLLDI